MEILFLHARDEATRRQVQIWPAKPMQVPHTLMGCWLERGKPAHAEESATHSMQMRARAAAAPPPCSMQSTHLPVNGRSSVLVLKEMQVVGREKGEINPALPCTGALGARST